MAYIQWDIFHVGLLYSWIGSEDVVDYFSGDLVLNRAISLNFLDFLWE